MRARAVLISLVLLAAACGPTTPQTRATAAHEHTAPSEARATHAAAPATPVEAAETPETPETPAVESPASAPTDVAPTLQLLGAEHARLLFLDTGAPDASSWTLESVDATLLSGVQSAVFLGCGERAALRTAREVAVFERTGALVGRAAIPSVARAFGARLAAAMAPIAEELETSPEDAAAAVSLGPLRRSADGRLVMDGVLDLGALYGEEEGFHRPLPDLQTEVVVPGAPPAPCESVPLVPLPLDPHDDATPPSGWRCAFVSAEHPTTLPWLPNLTRLVLAVASDAEAPCDPPAAGVDAWAHFRACRPDASGVAFCRAPDDATTLVAVVPPDSMDAGPGVELHAFRGNTLRASAGLGGRAAVVGDVWIYGGSRRWFVDAASRRAPILFGREAPDAVLGVAPRSP